MDTLIHIEHATQEFKKRQKEIEQIHLEAFEGAPWFYAVTNKDLKKHMDEISAREGFEAFTALTRHATIAGVFCYDTPSLTSLKDMWGDEIAAFSEKLLKKFGIKTIIFESEVFVSPVFQGKKIAQHLRMYVLEFLKLRYPKGVLLLTRMREDNERIIHIAEKLNYQRTGIKSNSTKTGIMHEYWYKLIM